MIVGRSIPGSKGPARPARAGGPAAVLGGLLLALAGPAAADCSRPISAPVAPAARLAIVEGERVSGVWPDFLRQLGADIGCRFEFPVLPRARLELELLAGETLDLMVPATQTPERDRRALFVPLLRQPLMLLTRSADAGKIDNSLEALRQSGWRTAILRSYAFSPAYRALIAELDAQHRVDYVNDADAIGRMLRAGRVEFALLPPAVAHSVAGPGMGLRRFEALPPLEVGVYLSTRTLAAPDLALLRDGLARAAREGRVRRAFARYYPPDVVEAILP